jgi:hypothetical protein
MQNLLPTSSVINRTAFLAPVLNYRLILASSVPAHGLVLQISAACAAVHILLESAITSPVSPNAFAKLHIAKDGPCNLATMISTCPGSNRSAHCSSQGSNQRVATICVNTNVSDHSGLTTPDVEAVDTVCQDHMEAYREIRLPILCWNLLHSKTDEPQISSVDLPLPQDAPLPTLLVAGLTLHRIDDSTVRRSNVSDNLGLTSYVTRAIL